MTFVDTIKVYGERNTGTNYLTRLLERNYDVQLPPGDVPRSFLNKSAIGVLRRVHRRSGLIVNNRTADRWFLSHFEESLGWKHCLPPVAALTPLARPGLAVLALMKNPYSWLLSMHRRPYQNFVAPERFEDFLTTPYPTVPRELMPEGARTPVQLWSAKVAGYYALKDAMPQVEVVQYEAFLADDAAALSALDEQWPLVSKGARQQVTESAKKDEHSYSDYQRYYLGKEWLSKLSPEALALINDQLDPEVMARAGYAFEGPGAASVGQAETAPAAVQPTAGT